MVPTSTPCRRRRARPEPDSPGGHGARRWPRWPIAALTCRSASARNGFSREAAAPQAKHRRRTMADARHWPKDLLARRACCGLWSGLACARVVDAKASLHTFRQYVSTNGYSTQRTDPAICLQPRDRTEPVAVPSRTTSQPGSASPFARGTCGRIGDRPCLDHQFEHFSRFAPQYTRLLASGLPKPFAQQDGQRLPMLLREDDERDEK
jgi:hypothetical protein